MTRPAPTPTPFDPERERRECTDQNHPPDELLTDYTGSPLQLRCHCGLVSYPIRQP